MVDGIIQTKSSPTPATWIGRGKVAEVRLAAEKHGAGLAIFDDDLSPAQIRNLEKELEIRVITRTELILDIFAQKARSHESKLQVEKARLEFSLTRMRHLWTHLEGQRGGRGARQGAGERQIEVDRRQARDRIAHLKRRLEEIRDRRAVQRKPRLGFPVGAVVGYTNVGKSTLINRLAGSDLHVEDKLFATLDAATRRVRIGDRHVLLTDTVGFIRKFPPQLAASFRSTIEEAVEADFLVLVADASHPSLAEQVRTVEDFLGEMGAKPERIVRVLNKIDLVKRSLPLLKRLPEGDWIAVSARRGLGIADLRDVIRGILAVSPELRFY